MTGKKFDYFHLNTLPRLHHIAWCRLPEGSDLKPGSTVRPALVRGAQRDEANRRGAVFVSFGTTVLRSLEKREVDLIIQNNARLAALDLPMAVRFDLEHKVLLPWATDFFAPPAHSNYMTSGPLNEGEKRRLRRCLFKRGIITAL